MSRLPYEPPPLPDASLVADEVLLAWPLGYIEGRQILDEQAGELRRDPLRDLVHVSLFTWRRADPDDELEEGRDPQGWWADPEFGSKLWLLMGKPITNQTVSRARSYAEQALAWMVTAGICSAVEVVVTRSARPGFLTFDIALVRPRGEASTRRYSLLWGV